MSYKSIAIDGPAGAGKSTISKLLAKKIGFDYLDTGAMYRVYTYYFISNNIDVKDEALINSHIDDIDLEIKDGQFYLNGVNVDKEIRSDEVTKNVSLISSYKEIRENLVEKQREISMKNNIILDGRDIGSHVLKNADIKFFLTASAEIRAKRRFDELTSDMSFEDVLKDIIRRDEFDSSRKISPLVMAKDAILIDSSNMKIDEVVNKMYKLAEERNVV
ncbi:MAG: (d)CMP kinase [Tissierellia bacterium]|nr:(d)CMP kinase [Tissierellia bacterium]